MSINSFYRGDTKTYKFTFTDSDSVAVDCTGWTIWFTLKEDETDLDAAAVLQVSTTAGDVADDDPTNGIMYLVVPATSTDSITPAKYYYDFQRVTSDGSITTLDSGRVTVKYDITRSII